MAGQTASDLARDICARHAAATTARGPLNAHLEEIALRVLPNYAGAFTTHGRGRTPGDKRTEEMVDATAALALTRFAAAMESMLTPRNSTWHHLVPTDKRLRQHRDTMAWLEALNERVFQYRYAPRANFASQKHEDYMALGAFGTGCMFVDGLAQPGRRVEGLRYRAIHLGEIHFFENFQGVIDTAVRRFSLTARQAIQQFGKAHCSDAILRAVERPGDADKPFWFLHCVKPRSDEEGYDPERLDLRGMSQASYYVDEQEKTLVKEGGYHSFPYAISRYVIAPGEIYGRSPAMLALPAINVLNEEKRTVLKQGHRIVDPVLLAHDDGVVDGFSLRPGAINAGGVTAEGRPLVHALPTGNLSLAKELMMDERATINDFFLVTLFQILVETPSMTATEVIERAREKGALLSPTMGRQQSESLGPMIEREIDLLMEQRVLEPMPPLLAEAGGYFEIEYDSPLSRLSKAESVAGLFRVVDYLREFVAVTGDPTPLDWINWDTAMPDVMESQAVKMSWRKSPEEVAALRQGRQEQADIKQMVDAAPAAASVMASSARTVRGARPR